MQGSCKISLYPYAQKNIFTPMSTKEKAPSFEICEGFRIRKVTTPAGKVRFQLDLGTKSGHHVRRTYKTKNEARAEARTQAVNVARKDFDAVKFTDAHRTDAVEALAILRTFDCNLRQAAHFYEKHHRPVDSSNDFAQLVEVYLSGMAGKVVKGALRSRSVEDTAKRLKPFKAAWTARNIGSIETSDIEAALEAGGWSGTNRKNYLRNLSVFFNAMLKQKRCTANPCAMVEAIPENIETPEIYTPAQAAKIIHKAEEKKPLLVPYLALCFFAGMRPEEAQRLDWDAIDFELSEIHIKADVSKTRTARIVTIPENLLVWLVRYRPKPSKGKVYPNSYSSLKRARKEVYKEAELTPIQDGARHSFATYYYALKGLDSTLDQLGHRSPAMLHKHYKGLAKNREKQSHKYFAIMPKDTAKVLQMPDAKSA